MKKIKRVKDLPGVPHTYPDNVHIPLRIQRGLDKEMKKLKNRR